MKHFKLIKNLSYAIILLTIVTTVLGLFYDNNGDPFYAHNIFGERIRMFGNGIYANESYFKAPIHKGTDALTLFLVLPLFFTFTILTRPNSLKIRLLHLGFLAYILYYASSIGFGVAMNKLYPVYIVLFSLSLITFIISISTFNWQILKAKSTTPHKSIAIFLFLAGCSVFVWLIEIIAFMKTGTIPATMGMNTNEVSFIIDLGIIAPTAFIASFSIIKRKAIGYLLSPIILTLNSLIGLVVISQSIFQAKYGIDIGVQALVAFVGVFVLMSLFASILNIKLLKNIENQN